MYLTVNSQNIFYQKVGLGPNLIMLHGWSQDLSSFFSVVDLLKSDFTLWLIDLPGFGRSTLPQKPFTVADYAEIIAQLIAKEHLYKSHLLGHSLGGRIAIKIAANHPQLINKLILEDSAGIKPQQDLVKPLLFLGAKFFNLVIPNIFNFKNKMRQSFYQSLEADYLTAGAMKPTLKNILAEDLTNNLAKIKNETLIIWGEKDRAVSLKDGKKMYQLIPNCRLEVFEETGHFPHLEKPELFAQFLKDFLS
ncbi:alpha/beta hydrolase [Patescibacteria group bacterium]|nr:alpha/beta hydrolase [Patescibacteria group bacterium]MCL5409990.1 alpha/beta hydrolase [Patescibacteria group bacterium]